MEKQEELEEEIKVPKRSFLTDPIFLNRTVMAWINLAFGIFNIVMGFLNMNKTSSLFWLNFILGGFFFGMFMAEGTANYLRKMLDETWELNIKMLKLVRYIANKEERDKGYKFFRKHD